MGLKCQITWLSIECFTYLFHLDQTPSLLCVCVFAWSRILTSTFSRAFVVQSDTHVPCALKEVESALFAIFKWGVLKSRAGALDRLCSQWRMAMGVWVRLWLQSHQNWFAVASHFSTHKQINKSKIGWCVLCLSRSSSISDLTAREGPLSASRKGPDTVIIASHCQCWTRVTWCGCTFKNPEYAPDSLWNQFPMAGRVRGGLDKELLCWSGCVDCALGRPMLSTLAEGNAEVLAFQAWKTQK